MHLARDSADANHQDSCCSAHCA